MTSRVLFFEGPPGGGKSSLSQFVARQLQAANISARWLEEHTLNSTIFAPLFAVLHSAPAEAITPVLAGWRQLSDGLRTSSDVYCLDGAFFHSTLKLLYAYDCDPVQIASYLQALYDLLTPFTPALVHLTGDVDLIVRTTIAERGMQWATNVAEDMAHYPCQQRQQRRGVQGLIDFFIESQRQFDAIADMAPFPYLRIDTTARAWEQYQQSACAWLDIPLQAASRTKASDFTEYVGFYQPPPFFPPAFKHPFEVEDTPEGLRLHMVFMRNFRLAEQEMDCFAIVGRPVQLEFVRDAQGNIQGAIYPFVSEQRFLCEKIMASTQ